MVKETCCHSCGKDKADQVCSGCKDVAYCNQDCQAKDWSGGGHKLICDKKGKKNKKNRLIHDAILELMRSEAVFFTKTLTVAQLRSFAQSVGFQKADGKPIKRRKDLDGFPFNHYFEAGKVALCLAGANACCLIDREEWAAFGPLYHKHVTQSWFQKYEKHLSGFGFAPLGEPVHVNDCICECGMNGCNRPIPLCSEGGILFKNNSSPLKDTVDKVFVSKSYREVCYNDLLSCVHFASTVNSGLTESELSAEVTYYIDNAPEDLYGAEAKNFCCTPCLTLGGYDPGDAQPIGQHFYKCYKSMQTIGFNLVFNMNEDEEHPWPDDAMAELWLAAAGRSLSRFFKWHGKESTIFYGSNVDVGSERCHRIIAILEEQQQQHQSA